jgi:hypothetical protein
MAMVYVYFAKWASGLDGLSVVERTLKNVVGEACANQRRKSSASFLIVDARGDKSADEMEKRLRCWQGSGGDKVMPRVSLA